MKKKSNVKKVCRRWSHEEDLLLVKEIKNNPYNLKMCFLAVAAKTGRSESGVAARWYTAVSKDSQYWCFFTASPKHVSRNRKNGAGTPSNESVWRKMLLAISSILS